MKRPIDSTMLNLTDNTMKLIDKLIKKDVELFKILTDTAMKLMEKWDVKLFVNTITITKFKYFQPLLGFKFKFLTAMKLMER